MFIDFRNRRAFTLLEIVLVVAILFLFVLLLIPAFHPGQPITLAPDATPASKATPAPSTPAATTPANSGRLSVPALELAPAEPASAIDRRDPDKSEAEKPAEPAPEPGK